MSNQSTNLPMNFLEKVEPPKTKFLNSRRIYLWAFILGLIIFNLFLVYPLFQGSYTVHLESRESLFLSGAQFIFDNFPDLSWNHLKFMGFPFRFSYPPLLPYTLAFIHFIFQGLSTALIYRILTALFYILTPITFYLFVRYLTKKEFTAIISALAYNLPLAALLFSPLREAEISFNWVPWPLIELTILGEGAHIIALAILPLATLFFLKFLRHPHFKNYLIAIILMALTVLVHWTGFFTLILLTLIVLFSELTLGEGAKKFKLALLTYLGTYGLWAFVYNFSFIQTYLGARENMDLVENYINLIPFLLLVIPLSLTALFLAFKQKPKLQPVLVGIIWFGIFFIIIGAWYWWGRAYAPDPPRYINELNLPLALLIGLITTKIFGYLRQKIIRYFKTEAAQFISLAFILTLIGLFVYFSFSYVQSSHQITASHPDIQSSSEYQTIAWFKDEASGERIYVTGNLSAWLNVFSQETSQVKGGDSFGNIFPYFDQVTQEIEKEPESELAILWLRALNASRLGVNSDFEYPDRFKEVLKSEYDQDGLAIYRIPLQKPQLVQIVERERFREFKPLTTELDFQDLKQYVNYIDNSLAEKLDYNFVGDQIRIKTSLREEQALGLQVNFDPYWKAYIDSQEIPIEQDRVGFMFVDPGEAGTYEITLRRIKSWDQWLGYILTALTIFIIFVYSSKPLRENLRKILRKTSLGYRLQPGMAGEFMRVMVGEETPHPEFIKKTKNYYQKVQDYDWVKVADTYKGLQTFFHKGRESAIFKLIKRYGRGDKYLDAGCGTGLILRHLPPGSVGLDINSKNIEKAKTYVPQATLVVSDVEEIPFPDRTFSTVICTSVLEHLPHPRKATREILRVLKPGGVLIGSVPFRSILGGKIPTLIDIPSFKEPYHHAYSKSELMDLLIDFDNVIVSDLKTYLSLTFVAQKKE